MAVIRLHVNIFNACSQALDAVFINSEKDYFAAQKHIEFHKKWGSRDRKLFQEVFYFIIRNYRRFEFSLQQTISSKNFSKESIALYCTIQGIELPENILLPNRAMQLWEEAENCFAIAHSIPDWLDDTARKQMDEKVWEREIVSQNADSKVVLRSKKGKLALVKGFLQQANIPFETVYDVENALILEKRAQLRKTRAFSDGWFEFQDLNSQRICQHIVLQENENILDACAGAGGKALALADVYPQNNIYAGDVDENKLHELAKRKKRAKQNNIHLLTQNELNPGKLSFNHILIDAPCSGTGTFSRNADLKLKLSPETYQRNIDIQLELLIKYAKMLPSKGFLYYATCSILPEENENQIHQFLQHNLDFKIINQWHYLPSETLFNGFYLAQLQKD